MSDLDRILMEKKNDYDAIVAPEDLEDSLRKALSGISRKKVWTVPRAASILLVAAILTYNSSTLAFYGKQLLGYDSVMDGSLIALGRLGKGQQIDKSHTFSDGTKVQVDWIMLDSNGMVIFYTVEDTTRTRNIEEISVYVSADAPFLNGSSGATGEMLKDEYKQKWVLTTRDVPKFFVQTITLSLRNQFQDGTLKEGEIAFKLDRSEALGETIRNRIDKKVELAGRTMTIESINMSPISTVVKGEVQDIISLGLDRMRGEALMPQALEMSLYADGLPVNRVGSGMSTNLDGSRFEVIFDDLPIGTKSVELVLDKISVTQKLSEIYTIDAGGAITLMDNLIKILKIDQIGDETFVTISSDIGTRIPGVVLVADGVEFPLVDTSEIEFDENMEDKFVSTRTLIFKGTGEELKLSISRIIYTKDYGITVYQETISE